MAFSDYKNVGQVQREYGIKYLEEDFIPPRQFEPSAVFLEEFGFNQATIDVFSSEGARAEAVIFPILREVYKRHHEKYSLWIQKALVYDDKLNGTPDYIVATRSELGKTVLDTPLVMMAEAKKNDFEQGWGQCLAELVAAQKLNGNIHRPVYGVVTDGKFWEFGKLTNGTMIKNKAVGTVNEMAELMGMLDFVFQSANGQSANGQSANGQSANGQSANGQSANGQS
jgi:hypothetical protein